MLFTALLVASALVGVAPGVAHAQETTTPVDSNEEAGPLLRVELTDGSSLVGRIVSETAGEVVFRTASGVEVRLRPGQIARRERLNGRIRDGAFVRLDPSASRLLLGSTARPIGQGNGYFALDQLLFSSVAFGIGDHVSMSGGTVLFPGLFFRLFTVAPKITLVSRRRGAFAVGTTSVLFLDETADRPFLGGLAYGVATLGTTERAFTVGPGVFYSNDADAPVRPAIVAGAETQVSNWVKLITENYVIIGSDGAPFVVSAGLRFFGDRIAGSVGLYTIPDLLAEGEISFPFLPVASFAYNF